MSGWSAACVYLYLRFAARVPAHIGTLLVHAHRTNTCLLQTVKIEPGGLAIRLACRVGLLQLDMRRLAEPRTCDCARGVALARVDRQVLLELQQDFRHHVGVVTIFALQKYADDTGLAPALKQLPKTPLNIQQVSVTVNCA